jgi:hypothetical protein
MTFMSSRRRSAALVAVLGLSLVAGGVAYAASAPAIQTSTPKFADQVTNIDVLRQQIKNYYGDPLAVTGSGLTGTWTSPLNLDSNYAKEASSVAADGARWLATGWRGKSVGKKAVVIDVDDTTLATWNYEIYSNWDYNSTTNGEFVTNERFPAVPGMVTMVDQAKAEGYAIIVITGRPFTQQAVTVGNLTNVGYPAPDRIFTKPLAVKDYPSYLQTACSVEILAGKSCTTDHYKAATRGYIESSLGYDIVANFGDQFSDFTGGFEDRTFKMPNPNYFLP